MISLTELNKAINDKVRTALTEAGMKVPLSPEDLSEPIRRPSIKITLEEGTSSRENSRMKRTGITVRLYYFARNAKRPKAENVQVREILAEAFLEEVKVGDYWIPILADVDFSITDGVLIATMELEYIERIPDRPESPCESKENMENLLLEQRLEG